jgi:uncharacterized protein
MNPQDNVAVIRRTYDAFAAGDVKAILENVAEKAEWINHGPEAIPYAGSWPGKARIRDFFRAIGESTTGGKVMADNFVAAGDAVVVTGRFLASVRNTGAEIDTPIAHVFTVRDGKITRWEGFSDTARVADAHKGKAAAGR